MRLAKGRTESSPEPETPSKKQKGGKSPGSTPQKKKKKGKRGGTPTKGAAAEGGSSLPKRKRKVPSNWKELVANVEAAKGNLVGSAYLYFADFVGVYVAVSEQIGGTEYCAYFSADPLLELDPDDAKILKNHSDKDSAYTVNLKDFTPYPRKAESEASRKVRHLCNLHPSTVGEWEDGVFKCRSRPHLVTTINAKLVRFAAAKNNDYFLKAKPK